MTELHWLDGYSGESTDQLLNLEGVYRTDSIVLAFEEAIGRKAFRIGAEQLTTAERVVLAVEALEREVNHDGYDGLFTNASEEVPHLVSSLVAIGCEAAADLTRSAIDVLEIDGPLTAEAVATVMERDDSDRDDVLDAHDQRFFKEIRGVDSALLSYIRANREQIALP